MDTNEAPDKRYKDNDRSRSFDKNQPSLSSLIIWNISKALEVDPNMNIRVAMRRANERLENRSHDVNGLISQDPEERHIACALLAWQQLGNKDTESLYEFIESHRNKILRDTSENSYRSQNICSVTSSNASKRPKGFIDHQTAVDRNSLGSSSFETCSMGPVLKLPVETKFVMRMDNASSCQRHGCGKKPKRDLKNKVEACCMDSACMEKLKEMEKATTQLRTRAAQLARREAERAELLERAEVAWRDLELGYQRRLLLAEEKEEDLAKQIKKSIEDRNAYKTVCTTVAQQLGKSGDVVESYRKQLSNVEKEVCSLACARLQLSEETAKCDAIVADQQCKTLQLERDLQFKEEQARRKLSTLDGMMESTRALTLEAERAMREELGIIKEQVAQVSSLLLEEDAENNRLKLELDELRQQKTNMFDDLENCKQVCDGHMHGIIEELNNKRKILREMKDKVIECQCKLPLDAQVEVKRTPSLAALCRCPTEEHILHSCSCTSVRTTLLSNLLSDLFSGLQAELGDTGTLMPCQLLKCLEDKHNWDRASVVKSNLRSFFSQLLLGELDTAIATSIEKYHATWIGVSCADKAKMSPVPCEDDSEGWQERYLEKRAQKLAGQLAEQLYQERADQLVEKAKEIVACGPPPCECQQHSSKGAYYPCLVKPLTIGGNGKKNDADCSPFMKRTQQDVTLLRTQIEDLKKDSIKKEDLRIMEEKFTKIVQRGSGPDSSPIIPKNTSIDDQVIKQKSTHKSMNTEELTELNGNKSSVGKKKNNSNTMKKSTKKGLDTNGRLLDNKPTGKAIKKVEQSYAVNLCLVDGKNKPDSRPQNITTPDELNSWKEELSQNVLSKIPSIKYSRPMNKLLSKENSRFKNRKKSSKTACLSRCTCFHKAPSNTSINKLLEALLKWKGDLLNSSLLNINSPSSVLSKSNNDCMKVIHHDSEFSNNKKSVNMSNNQQVRSQNVSPIGSVKTAGTKQLQPPLTTSEYIGAINLDKSNDHICNYDKSNILKHRTNMNNNNLIFNCIHTSKTSCKKSCEIDKDKNDEGNEVSLTSKQLNAIALTDIKQLEEEHNILEEKLLKSEACKSLKVILSNKNNQTSESNFLPHDTDVQVKFLGVTLTDINKSGGIIEKGRKKQNKSNYNTSILLNNNQKDFGTKDKHSVKSDQRKLPDDVQHEDGKTKYRTKTNQCQLLQIFTNLDADPNQCGDKSNENKNDQCLSEMLYDTQSCVCCSHDDETKNLEVNTFTLLENYLKNKLDEFKKSSAKSSSILPDEEEKVFITILDKVKQVISNCTYNVKCECSVKSDNSNVNSGSWMRFNNLLEEYLKVKIKRVQCTCIPNTKSLDTILPGILEQVSHLIEVDFERLKNLCKTERTNNSRYDKNIFEKYRDHDIVDNSGSPEPEVQCIDIENVSVQASYNLGIENKSCDAIQLKDTKDMQTSHNNLLLDSHSVEVLVGHCCNSHKALTSNHCLKEPDLKPQVPCERHLDTIRTSTCKLNDKNKDLNKISSYCSLRVPPYVGYTLSSSCDNFNSCDCAKTLSHTYVKKIHNIWEMLEVNKKLIPNLSYIMNGIPKAVRSESNIVNYVEVADGPDSPAPETSSVKNISASDGEEITLKDSDVRFRQSDINDNMTNTLDDLVSVQTECLNDDDTCDWYDCSPSPRSTRNDFSHKKALYDSIFSPLGKLAKHGKSDTSVKNNVTICTSKSKNCDCVMVPVCHVKMLVENIENKLVNSQCTCDSLSAQVCPLHSKTLTD